MMLKKTTNKFVKDLFCELVLFKIKVLRYIFQLLERIFLQDRKKGVLEISLNDLCVAYVESTFFKNNFHKISLHAVVFTKI